MTPRRAMTAVFFADGALFATWASRIPALSDRGHATVGVLGLCLLAPAAAAVVAMPLVGRRLQGRSSRGFCRVAVAGLAVAILLPALARSPAALAATLLVVGFANATLDLVMNAQGVSIERSAGRPILASLHAAFSLGGFAGAGGGALAAGAGLAPLPHFALAGLGFALPVLLVSRALPREEHDTDRSAPTLNFTRLPRGLLLLGVACFFALVAEGGASDWSAKLIRDDLAGSAAVGALAYAAFSIAMAAGRLAADRLWARWGAAGLVRRGAGLAAAGLAASLALGTVPAVVAGFALFGLGLAGVVPTLFRAGADQPGVATGPALAAVSSLGYLGFLAGPPAVGLLAQITSVRLACALLALAAVLVVVLARAADPTPESADR